MKLLLLLALVLLSACLQQDFKGIELSPSKPAQEFSLINQFGEQVKLSDFRGKVVVLSFLYTSCPTVCPVITQKFTAAANELGDLTGSEVIFVAVTVDPERDTVEKIREYSAGKGMLDKWHYLTGGKSAVEKVWRDYGVYVNKSAGDTAENYFVDHTTTVVVIDKKGNLRLVFPGLAWDSKDLAQDVRLLLRE